MRLHLLPRLLAPGLLLLAPSLTQAQKASRLLNPTTSKGILVPRLSATQRRALIAPATATLVFQTDSTAGFYYYTGAAWLNLTKYNVPVPTQPKPAPKALAAPHGLPTQVSTLAGQLNPGRTDGKGASFSSPHGVAVGSDGTVYVADTYNHRIRTISPAGVVRVLAGGPKGYAEGSGTAARFDTPTGLALDGAGTLYVADAGNNRIRRISPAGVVSTLAGGKQGYTDGSGATAAFHNPYGVAVSSSGMIYVADASNNRICRVTPDGVVVTLAGLLSGLSLPTGVAVDATETVYVADANNNLIRKIAPDGTVSTLAGGDSGYADGAGPAARFNHPIGLALDDAGMVYVSEQGNNRVRRITPTGEVSTVAGSGIATFANGRGAAAAFNLPVGVAADAAGTLYVADMGNNSIRKIVAP